MSDLTRIEQNNAELRECIEIAESLPDAPQTVGGYDIATMQKFIDAKGEKGLEALYSPYTTTQKLSLTNADIEWLTKVDLTKCSSAQRMFYSCESDDWDAIPLFDASHITNMKYAFSGASNKAYWGAYIAIPNLDTSKATDMSYICNRRLLSNFPSLKYDSAINVSGMFYDAKFKNDVRLGILNFPNATDASMMFYQCKEIRSCEGINAPKCTNFSNIFYNITVFESVGDIISNASNIKFSYAFQYCSYLTSVGALPASVENYRSTFGGCSRLITLPTIETKDTTEMNSMFYDAQALETVSLSDFRNVTSCASMFGSCKKLTNLTIKNIKINLQVGSGTSWGHLLTVDSLVGLCYELCDTGSVKTLTIGSANLEKLASVYVRQITITDEMRAEDDLIDDKLPFERCESTDEGAMLITNYVIGKNWSLT